MLMSNAVHHSSRILLVAPQPFYEDRGTPIAIRHVLEALSVANYNVDLLTFDVGSDIELPGLRICRVGGMLGIKQIPIGFSLRKLALDIIMTFALLKMLRNEDYACVHAVEEAVFPSLLIARRHRIPVIYDMQSCIPDQLRNHPFFGRPLVQRILRGCEGWALNKAALVIGSAGLRSYVRKVAPSARIEEWHFPGQPNLSSAAQVAECRRICSIALEAPVVLYSGNFARYQGVTLFVEAIPQILKTMPDAVFVLVGGDESSMAPDMRKAMRLVPPTSIRILPRQPRETLPAFIAMADVLVSPRAEGDNLPLKVFDYIAAGKAIVATDYPIHRTILSDERALLVEPNAAAFATGVIRLLKDRRLADQLGAAAQLHSDQNYGLAPFQRFVDEMYRQVSDDRQVAAEL